MRTENDLRSALLSLEREAPRTEEVLRRVAGRSSAGTGMRGRRPGRRLLAGSAAAAAVVAVAIGAALVASVPHGQGRATPLDALRSVPRYYMALVPKNLKSYEQNRQGPAYAVVRDTITGRTLATIRPPKPYVTFVGVYGADDDRTFVLAAQSTEYGSQTAQMKFFYARFSPAGNAVTLTPLALRGLPVSNSFAGAALSPDGTRLAVEDLPNGPTQITVYSLPSGAARTWTAYGTLPQAMGADPTDLLSWSASGILAFGWFGSSPVGEYLLNTNGPGGSLLADSRAVVCLEHSVPSSAYVGADYYGYLTPGGKAIISPVLRAIPVGQAVPSCSQPARPGVSQPTPGPTLPPTVELEEFSATTGQPVRVIYTSQAHGALADSDVYWSNASGSVLVVEGGLPHNARPQSVFGVLSGGTFTPLPESSGSSPIPVLAF